MRPDGSGTKTEPLHRHHHNHLPDGVPDPERQNRDASAIQAKLDELIRAGGKARNEFIGIEHLSEPELIALLRTLEEIAGDEDNHRLAIARLIKSR
jgi:low affinity Fe/Cu permease